MRWLLLILLLAACAPIDQNVFDEYNREPEVYNPSSLEAQGPAYVQTATGELIRRRGVPEDPDIKSEWTRQATITEGWREGFWNNVDYYSYEIDSDAFGRLYYFHTPEFTRIVPLDRLIEIDGSNTAMKSRLGAMADNEYLLDDIRDGKAVMSYVWLTGESSHGCFIKGGDPLESNCYYWGSGVPIIHNDFVFEGPMTPLDWLDSAAGKKPVEIREGYTFTDPDGEQQITVDQYFFENADGTQTKMHVHSGYKIPVKVEIIAGSNTLDTIVFEDLTINDPEIRRYYRRLLTP